VNIHAPAFTRRRFLHALGSGALLTALPGPLFAQETGAVTISILHTTDLHGHILPTVDYQDRPDLGGLARCATQIRHWREANPNSLVLDIGDVYQGTEAGLSTRGAIMVRCLDALRYDAWVVGNHEFDWGIGPFADALKLSSMPVLCGNALAGGRPAGAIDDTANPFSRLKPWLIRDVAGIRLAIVGLTTPALTSWLPVEKLTGFEALDPVESLRALLREVAAMRPDAIVLAGHMGLKRRDDDANRIGALTREFPQLAVCLGGHTHQNHPGELVNKVLYTQADHFGIYAGKVDLTFDCATRRLLRREAVTVAMDNTIPLDPLVLSLARADLDRSSRVLSQPIGDVTEILGIDSEPGRPSDIERLFGSAIIDGLAKRGVAVDAVIHGTFDDRHPLRPGHKTVADAWRLLPYENEIVTIDVSLDDFQALSDDFTSGNDTCGVMAPRLASQVDQGRVVWRPAPGEGVRPTYRVALNSYDSQSGGGRFTVAARLVAQASSHRVLHPLLVRNALIDFFVSRGKMGKNSLLA
jgi:2',3'-cyclic-nucleotide 2'-phosphodiesterase/3'-nucleotidase